METGTSRKAGSWHQKVDEKNLSRTAPPTGVCARWRRQGQRTNTLCHDCVRQTMTHMRALCPFQRKQRPLRCDCGFSDPSTPPHPLLLCRVQGEDLRGSRGGNVKGWYLLCSLRGSFSVLQPFCGKEERFGQGLWPNTEACFWSDIRKVKKVFERWDNYLILWGRRIFHGTGDFKSQSKWLFVFSCKVKVSYHLINFLFSLISPRRGWY